MGTAEAKGARAYPLALLALPPRPWPEPHAGGYPTQPPGPIQPPAPPPGTWFTQSKKGHGKGWTEGHMPGYEEGWSHGSTEGDGMGRGEDKTSQ